MYNLEPAYWILSAVIVSGMIWLFVRRPK